MLTLVQLSPAHAVKLGLALNYCVFVDETIGDVDQAYALAQKVC